MSLSDKEQLVRCNDCKDEHPVFNIEDVKQAIKELRRRLKLIDDVEETSLNRADVDYALSEIFGDKLI